MPIWARRPPRGRGEVVGMPPPEYQPNWFADSFDAHYERIYRHTDDNAAREVRGILRYLGYAESVRARGARVLDVGCGWGRHAIPLAKKGFRVTGIDLSEVMLTKAREAATAEGLVVSQAAADDPDGPGVAFEKCDMRDLAFKREFDVALNMFTSFGYFEDPADNGRVLRNVFAALKPGGKFLIDVDNPRQYVRRRVGNTYVTIIGDDGEAHEVLREERYDWDRDRRVVQYRFDDLARDPIYLECALYDRRGLTELLEEAGFRVQDKAWGDFDGMRYSDRSPRLIVISERPNGV